LWRRIAFSILITNLDDHLRNHGFLHVDREFWRLSPAFDINPSPERVRALKTWISEDAGPDMTIGALLSVIPYFRITAAPAKEILSDVVHAVEDWRRTGKACIREHRTELPRHCRAGSSSDSQIYLARNSQVGARTPVSRNLAALERSRLPKSMVAPARLFDQMGSNEVIGDFLPFPFIHVSHCPINDIQFGRRRLSRSSSARQSVAHGRAATGAYQIRERRSMVPNARESVRL